MVNVTLGSAERWSRAWLGIPSQSHGHDRMTLGLREADCQYDGGSPRRFSASIRRYRPQTEREPKALARIPPNPDKIHAMQTSPTLSILLFSGLCLLGGFANAFAQADFYLQANQTSNSHHWNLVGATTGWHDAVTGGSQATAMDPDAVYDSNGFDIRTQDAATDIFGGKTLILNGSAMILKGQFGRISQIAHLISEGTTAVRNGDTGTMRFTIGEWDAFGTTAFTSADGRNLTLAIGALSGNGTFNFFADNLPTNTYNLDITNGSAFTGEFLFTQGTLALVNDLTLGGALTLTNNSRVNLTHSITVSSLVIDGVTLAADTYDYDYLTTHYGSIFTAGSAEFGQITVGSVIPEPSSVAFLTGGLALGITPLLRRRR